MSVVVRERAPQCAASRARRASGREAAIRNFCFVLPIEMRGLQAKLQTDLLVKHFFTKRYRPFRGLFSEQRLAGMPSDLLACGVAQANNFVPIGGPVFGNFRPQWWRERDGNRGWARKERAVAQKTTRASKRNGNDGNPRNDRRVECAELKRPDAFFGNECTFGKNEDGISIANSGCDLLNGFTSRICVGTNKRKVPHLAKKRSDERHIVNFAFGDEAIRNAETHHQREHVEVAGVIRGVDFRARRVHKFLADDADARTCKKKENP